MMAMVLRCWCTCNRSKAIFSVTNQFRRQVFTLARHTFAIERRLSFDVRKRPGATSSIRHYSVAKSVVESAPVKWQPFLQLMRADKPIGTWLLLWPGTWSIALAASPGQLPDFYLLSLFGIGAFLMRSAGCVINDLHDKDFDGKVERTKSRPLASGQLSTIQALALLSGLLTASLAVLLQLNWFSVCLGAASLIPVATYPLFKRFTHWPQVMLGLTMNWGCLLGWPAVKDSLDISAVLPLYVAAINWTLVYDTIYAHQDKTDDLAIGVGSTAIRFGDQTKYWLSGFGTIMIASLAISGYNVGLSWPFYVGVGATAAQIGWQVLTVNINKPEDCWKKFVTNKHLGLLIFLSITLGNYCI